MKLATITAPEMDYNNADKGDALHSMEVALAMERLNLQVCPNFDSKEFLTSKEFDPVQLKHQV